MTKFFKSLAFIVLATGICSAQDKMPYKIFTSGGKPSDYSKMIAAAAKYDVILFGEEHNNSIVHWLELELAKDLAEKRAITIGLEMIETDNQQQLDQYLNGEVAQKQFDTIARLWPNYKTDYKPIVDYAKNAGIKVVATNVPRRYASMVYKGGFEALTQLDSADFKWIAPLPVNYDPTLPGYKKIVEEMGGHGGENLPKAQALKDATMAHSILQNLSNSLFIHYNGTYHSDNFEGIFWYLKNARPKLKVMTIATVSQKDLTLSKKDHHKADFIIVTDEDVTKTY